ncbi:acyl carrier protein [Micromonospora endophytica]|uniref:Actinorhodin polyketide synthase n=1 Tax=Micromonospora endophytica TaxID=515350 RepID=A0A2W2DN76_9ACTN|nr:acyl carrier protein [Micromonospora endophytica]PZG01218.1 actinorhodin polyketide synthase [Micromonospora endophytica]RIW45841.1 acyl carrier protein [Micromonospora endophytica]BCJ61898.1 actinorhodin polyketide synthase acyl carrier protein [Micromonospora endophytica]
MTQLSIDDIHQVLVESAGEVENIAPDEDVTGRTFEELGYDSLALIETAAQLRQRFGIHLEDDAVLSAETLGGLLALANAAATRRVEG